MSIAEFAITRFDDEYEDPRNRRVVPEFKEIITRLDGKVDIAKRVRKQAMKADVNAQLGIEEKEENLEETASQSFFNELSQFTERFKRRHGDVDLGEDQE